MREGFAATSLCWVFISVMGAVPFVLTGCIPNPVDALTGQAHVLDEQGYLNAAAQGEKLYKRIEFVKMCIRDRLAGEYDYWFQVLEKDDDELIEYYRDVLKNMFLCENRSDKRSPLDLSLIHI